MPVTLELIKRNQPQQNQQLEEQQNLNAGTPPASAIKIKTVPFAKMTRDEVLDNYSDKKRYERKLQLLAGCQAYFLQENLPPDFVKTIEKIRRLLFVSFTICYF